MLGQPSPGSIDRSNEICKSELKTVLSQHKEQRGTERDRNYNWKGQEHNRKSWSYVTRIKGTVDDREENASILWLPGTVLRIAS
jgi:hypothetical protein